MNRRVTNLFRSKPQRQRAKSKSSRLAIEALEDRQMMAADFGSIPGPITGPVNFNTFNVNSPANFLMAGIQDDILYIRGTDSGETINVRQQNGAVQIDGLASSYNTDSFEKIIVRAFGGLDKVYLNSEATSGQQAITKPTEIIAGSGNDEIIGGQASDAIFGEAGVDKIWGNYGDDWIDGGLDGDQLQGDAGYDKIFGDLGNDQLFGASGNDHLIGGDGLDYLYGGKGIDRLDGGLGFDYLYGQDDHDYLYDETALKFDGMYDSYYNSSLLRWFDTSLQDAGLRSATRYAHVPDSFVSRAEMMTIFDTVADGNTVDATEFGDLQDIVGSTELSMLDHVRSLANCVVNGDQANVRFQGDWLGSIYAGATFTNLDKLVDKWFLGLDRPLAQYTDSSGNLQTVGYQYVQGSLFQNGIDYTDISQGQVGDCYFLATLASLAERDPSVIQNMFIDNSDGTFTVGFHRSPSLMHYVTVDRYLPTLGDDRIFASFGTDKDNASNELWVALLEKAYVQLNESGWIGQADALNSYQAIAGGRMENVMAQVTGWSTAVSEHLSFDGVVRMLNLGKLVTTSSIETPKDSRIAGTHAYAILDYNSSTGKFTVINPWGLDRGSYSLSVFPATFELTWNEIATNFYWWGYTA